MSFQSLINSRTKVVLLFSFLLLTFNIEISTQCNGIANDYDRDDIINTSDSDDE